MNAQAYTAGIKWYFALTVAPEQARIRLLSHELTYRSSTGALIELISAKVKPRACSGSLTTTPTRPKAGQEAKGRNAMTS